MPADEDHPEICPNVSSVGRACDVWLRKHTPGYAARQDEISAKMRKSHAARRAERLTYFADMPKEENEDQQPKQQP